MTTMKCAVTIMLTIVSTHSKTNTVREGDGYLEVHLVFDNEVDAE